MHTFYLESYRKVWANVSVFPPTVLVQVTLKNECVPLKGRS